MELRIVRRGLAALVVAGTLGAAGASPAAAEELGWLDRGALWFSGLWAGEDAGARAGAEDGATVAIWSAMNMDKGMGLDPNGGTLPPPSSPPGNGN